MNKKINLEKQCGTFFKILSLDKNEEIELEIFYKGRKFIKNFKCLSVK
jgi:hypothetical protein